MPYSIAQLWDSGPSRASRCLLFGCLRLLCLSLGLAPAVASLAADVLVVCPESFRPALKPWVEHRSRQGLKLDFISNRGSADEIRAEIKARAKTSAIRYVVLVGDAALTTNDDAETAQRITPTSRAESKVVVKFRSEAHIASDNAYADLDDDGVPDLAVGRLPADSPAELERIVRKIIDYERAGFGPWRQKIHFIGGIGGYGAVIDSAVEQWARRLITEGVPTAYATTLTHGSWQSPFCPAPSHFRQTTVDRLNEGGLFWVYMGHGSVRNVDAVNVGERQFPILAVEDMKALANRQSPPIALFLSCYTGAFDAREDCLGEEMLRTPGGPVAVVCGSRVTMPYAMAVFGNELMHEWFGQQPETLGELLLHAKRNTVLRERSDDFSVSLDTAAKALNPKSDDLAAERAEHLLLFNLLGDPLLQIAHPQPIELQVASAATAGGELEVSGTTTVNGHCTCELVVRRDRLTFKAPVRDAFVESPESTAAYNATYRAANNPCLATARCDVVDGRFRVSLAVPPEAHGSCHVRVFVEGTDSFALGHTDLKVQRGARTARQAAAEARQD